MASVIEVLPSSLFRDSSIVMCASFLFNFRLLSSLGLLLLWVMLSCSSVVVVVAFILLLCIYDAQRCRIFGQFCDLC